MARFFSVENPFFSMINKFVDLLFLSVVTDVLLAPVVVCGIAAFQSTVVVDPISLFIFVISTALVGPVLTGLYYAVAKSVRRDRGYAVREFFRSFKANFKQGALISMIFGLVSALLFLDFSITANIDPTKVNQSLVNVMSAVFKAIVVIMLMIFVFVFPVLSRFSMKLKSIISTAFMMSIKHLPKTLLLILIALVTWAMPPAIGWLIIDTEAAGDFTMILESYFTVCFPFYLILPGLGTLLASLVLEKIFKIYIKPAEGTEEETGEDRWYLE